MKSHNFPYKACPKDPIRPMEFIAVLLLLFVLLMSLSTCAFSKSSARDYSAQAEDRGEMLSASIAKLDERLGL